jgi:hypothetical protein
MKQKTRRIIKISAVLLAVALCGWYFYPVYMYKFYFYKFHSLRDYLEMTPVEITALKPPPKEWTTISIGGLILRLPMSRYKIVGGRAPSISPGLYFKSETGLLLITDIVRDPSDIVPPPDHLTRYRWKLAIFKSTPADISVFNSRSKNIRAFINQICKAIDTPLYRPTKILAVNTGTLKAICNISEKREKCYTAFVDAFNQNETVSVNVMLKDYKEVGLLESDLFGILAGIKMSDRRPDKKEVERDIKSIVAKFKKKT